MCQMSQYMKKQVESVILPGNAKEYVLPALVCVSVCVCVCLWPR